MHQFTVLPVTLNPTLKAIKAGAAATGPSSCLGKKAIPCSRAPDGFRRHGQLVAGCTASTTGSVSCDDEAWSLLVDFTRKDARGLVAVLKAEDRANLRQAVQVVANRPVQAAGWDPGRQPRDLIIAVLASDLRLAVRSLRDYCDALGVEFIRPVSRVAGADSLAAISGSVYIKYIAASGLCYVSSYQGRDRGVLLQFGQQQVGHLPLGLFDEQMQKPAPSLQQ